MHAENIAVVVHIYSSYMISWGPSSISHVSTDQKSVLSVNVWEDRGWNLIIFIKKIGFSSVIYIYIYT